MGNLDTGSMQVYSPRVLVVDDEESNCIVFVRALQLMGYEAESAANGKAAMEKLSKAKFDVMLLDLKMPEMDGETVLKTVHTLYPDLGVIVLTAHATLESAIGAVKAGAVDYLLKPQKISDIEATIRKALKRREVARQKEALVNVMEQALSVLKEDNPPNSPTQMQEKVLHVGRLIIDSEQRLLTILPDPSDKSQTSTRTVELTEVQAQIMLYLATHKQQVIGSIEIAVKALGYTNLTELEAERIVRPHILRLRRKLETTPERPQFIRSVRGKGYCFSNYSPDSNLEDN